MKKVFVILLALLALTNCEKISDFEIVDPSNSAQLKAAEAQSEVGYSYQGNNFNLFSCDGNNLCSDSDPLHTSYTTSDFITAVITLDEPLPGNLNLENIRDLPGFTLTMTDGHQVLTLDPGVPGEAFVSTDADGNIIAPWHVFVNCCLYPNNNVFAINSPEVRGVGDGGYLTCPNGSYPDTPRDGGMIFGTPGEWTTNNNTPEELVADLMTDIESLIDVELKNGQANGLTKPLTNALRSISKGKISAACSQLSDFIEEVNAKTPPLSESTAAYLIDEAIAIMDAIGC